MNIGSILTKSAKHYPGNWALIYRDKKFSYSEINERVNKLANAFLNLGLQKCDRVSIFQYNCPQLVETLFASWKAGLAVVPINFRLHPREVAYIIEDSESLAFVFGKEFKSSIQSIRNEITRVKYLISTSNSLGAVDYEELLANSEPNEVLKEVNENDLAWLFYTSGTTGKPKGAMLTHRNLLAMTIDTLAEVIHVNPEDVALHVAPLTHGSGLYLLPIVARGATNIILESKSFNPELVLEAIEKHKVTIIPFMVPTQIKMLLDVDTTKYDLSSLKYIVYGGAPIHPEDLKEAIRKFGQVFVQIYGQGESPMTISCLRREEHVIDGTELQLKRLSSAGIPRINIEVKIVDENDKEVPTGVIGEIVVRGDTVMKGYWKRPEATDETLKGGWLHTGDLGYVDKYGYIYIMDRKKDVIISGGANIYPREVEDIIMLHPAVHEVAVIGIPDPLWGESVKAFVVLRKSARATEEEIIEFCKKHLASYKKPKSVEFVKSLPKSGYGKILKRELKRIG